MGQNRDEAYNGPSHDYAWVTAWAVSGSTSTSGSVISGIVIRGMEGIVSMMGNGAGTGDAGTGILLQPD